MFRAIARTVIAFVLMTCGAPVHAQYPNRPVTIIVSLAAGSGMDVLVRLYADANKEGKNKEKKKKKKQKYKGKIQTT